MKLRKGKHAFPDFKPATKRFSDHLQPEKTPKKARNFSPPASKPTNQRSFADVCSRQLSLSDSKVNNTHTKPHNISADATLTTSPYLKLANLIKITMPRISVPNRPLTRAASATHKNTPKPVNTASETKKRVRTKRKQKSDQVASKNEFSIPKTSKYRPILPKPPLDDGLPQPSTSSYTPKKKNPSPSPPFKTPANIPEARWKPNMTALPKKGNKIQDKITNYFSSRPLNTNTSTAVSYTHLTLPTTPYV